MKGQLFSVDAVIAIAVIAVVAGMAASASQSALSIGAKHAEISSTLAEAVAASAADGVKIDAPTHCLRYGNGTDGCADFECPANVFSARRVIDCGTDPCLLEVLTCE